jgi:hypothetical protein
LRFALGPRIFEAAEHKRSSHGCNTTFTDM